MLATGTLKPKTVANTLRPRSRMLLKVMKGGLGGGHYPLGHPPGSILPLRGTGDAASGLLAENPKSLAHGAPFRRWSNILPPLLRTPSIGCVCSWAHPQNQSIQDTSR